jgi:7-carboxy-7-deazaguanine synthase
MEEKLPLVEEFYTLQGEGFHSGKAAYFIRLGGCDVACSWCDTKHSWNSELFPPVPTDDIIRNIITCPAKAVVVTGGEPLLYNLNYLCSQLKLHGITTFLETSGTNTKTGIWDWICLSPKISSPPIDELYMLADELKIIIAQEEDLEWAELNAKKVNEKCILYLQPEWSKKKLLLPVIFNYILKYPKWKISNQMHKYIGIP